MIFTLLGQLKTLAEASPLVSVDYRSKRGMYTDIHNIYHYVTDKFVKGLPISFYLTYMGSHDSNIILM
jgi:hypothetical protein